MKSGENDEKVGGEKVEIFVEEHDDEFGPGGICICK